MAGEQRVAFKQVLITGGSGMIGKRLSELLIAKGYSVSWLSRQKGKKGAIKIYEWDLKRNFIEEEAIKNADYIIHLAGSNVAGKRWTKDYKREILESRTESAKLINRYLGKIPNRVKTFIGCSAIGIYGSDRPTQLLVEHSAYGNDFLAEVTKAWENAESEIEKLSIRTVKLRVGVVLSGNGGALEPIAKTVKLGMGASLGSGKQYVSWIHLDDVCGIFIKALEDNEMRGVYNAVASLPVTNSELTHAVALSLNKKIVLPNVPAFMLKIILGEFATSVLGSSNVSNNKILQTGFKFKYETLEEALSVIF